MSATSGSEKRSRDMTALDGRVAIITGAGRGIGREHAILFAAEGAKVVVNDLGGGGDVPDTDLTSVEQVVAEIRDAGGEAIGNGDDISDWNGGRRLIRAAVDAFGDLDILVNNAGILRDRALVNMTEDEWDAVIAVHLKGHFVPTRWAAAYWREQHKNGSTRRRHLVHTTSTSGLFANTGQTNYGSAKSGVATFSQICAKELGRYRVSSNCVAPSARTRLTLATPGLNDVIAAPTSNDRFDVWDPANVSPLVAYLASEACTFQGETFFVQGGTVKRVKSWELAEEIQRDERWSVQELATAMSALDVS
jgi:NAD(P)-dependent dehydrogenase (short-subunit alcohol dehydrogenase family)